MPTAPRSPGTQALVSRSSASPSGSTPRSPSTARSSVPNQSGHIYLVTNRHGQHRLITVSRPTITGEMYGILTTLLAGRGSLLTPIAAPIAFVPFAAIAEADVRPRSAERCQPRDLPASTCSAPSTSRSRCSRRADPGTTRDGRQLFCRGLLAMPGKRVQIDDETWAALDILAKDRMQTFQELAEEAFADV